MVDGLTGEIAAALERGTTVLTGNQRAARELRRAWDTRNRDAGLTQWSPAHVLAWTSWTAGLWHGLILEGTAQAMLLNRAQEASLWRSVIAGDESLATLRSTEALAGMAANAWAALARFRGLGRLKGSATNRDTEAFAAWAAAFDERCHTGRLLPEAGLEASLRKALKEGTLRIANEILLVGFDRLVPAQEALLEAIADIGVRIETAEQPDLPQERFLSIAEDEAQELRLAAHWIRRYLDDRPEARVAVVVPGLADERARIGRVFREILAPGSQAIGFAVAGPFEFSAGEALVERPMIAAALDLLAWAEEALDLERVSQLLLSPYVATGAEQPARAEFDAFELRRAAALRPEIRLDGLIAKLEASKRRERLSRTLAALRGLRSVAERRLPANARRPYGDWAEAIREMLQASGWGRRGSEDSVEFQTRERWESTLDELATLDFEGGRVPYRAALDALRSIVTSTVFAPEAQDAPVQVLAPEESAGQRCDAIWFLRAGEFTWPTPVSGSPFLSWPLRRELSMPGSLPADDAAFARWVTDRVARCAAETVIFSYARELPEEKQKASATLTGLHLEPLEGTGDEPVEAIVAVEEIADDLPIATLPDRPVAGGARVLQSQAACGFRAFAEHRLFASGIDTRALGMDARERGIAVHLVLERFWELVRTQAALRAMTTEARRATLSQAIDEALDSPSARVESAWDEAYLETQRQRLMSIGMEWLAMEAKRTVPFTVAERELAKEVTVGPLRLSLRVDRVDEIEGGAVLIDYKTGDAKPSAWLSDRPDEPQLPLYAVLSESDALQAVAFGLVRPGKEMALTGFESSPGTLTKPARDFLGMPDQIAQWRQTLTTLAEEFASGSARISPKIYPVTCAYCEQRLICRVDGAALLAVDEEGEDDRG
ncbi:probable DNA repair protein [Granulicella pectinivorans]|uniref:Probable DNA repair protein n=1 Tax=Granulicella pectinivorans TaxID=474950 RepID=A0A1I6MIX9_9BACT|nr:PD-(D/E)XK nuclease family protein [Granulicella pectinivorans]SFS15629.1 probable DNA repair protein [Granulicella pectinivorans]